MQEYQRQCQVCGKVWHSLVSREQQIHSLNKANSMQQCGGAMQSVGKRCVPENTETCIDVVK
jgi:hypothetical protein